MMPNLAPARSRRCRFRLGVCGQLGYFLLASAVFTGCRAPVQEESFSKPFDGARVVRLSHEAYQVAWNARFWAGHDLRFAVRPTPVDYEALHYLNEISRRVAWIATKVEKNPASPRVSSKDSYDNVAYDAMMLRLRYQPASFMPSTDAQIEKLLALLGEIAPYYAKHERIESPAVNTASAPAR